MQINRLYLLSVHSCRGGFFGWRLWWWEMLLLVSSDFSFWLNIFTAQHPAVQQQQQQQQSISNIWGHRQHSGHFLTLKKTLQTDRSGCAHLTILSSMCAVWYSVVTQTSRAANMAIHVLLWRCVCVNKWLTKRKYNFKLPTFTLYRGLWHIVSIKNQLYSHIPA